MVSPELVELIGKLVWPVFAALFVMAFYKPIKDLFGRIERSKLPGVDLSFRESSGKTDVQVDVSEAANVNWGLPYNLIWFVADLRWAQYEIAIGADPAAIGFTLGKALEHAETLGFGDEIIGHVKRIKGRMDKYDLEDFSGEKRAEYFRLISVAIDKAGKLGGVYQGVV